MSRMPRQQEPGAMYHVMAHSIEGTDLVRDDNDRLKLFSHTTGTVRRYDWKCIAICVLDTHYHLMVTTTEANLSDGMRYLNGCYAQNFNRRHGRRGHLFRERFRSRQVQTDAHLLLAVRYIALNPVAAGLATESGSFRWSSYPGLVGLGPRWSCIDAEAALAYFGKGLAAVSTLRNFVEGDSGPTEDDLQQIRNTDPFESLQAQAEDSPPQDGAPDQDANHAAVSRLGSCSWP